MQCSKYASLFDHLVRECEQRRGDFQAERLYGLEVDDEIEPGRSHGRQIDRLSALEYAANVDAGMLITVDDVGPIAHQATRVDELTRPVDRGNCMARRQPNESVTLDEYKNVGADKQSASTALDHSGEGRVHLAFGAGVQDINLQPESPRRGLCRRANPDGLPGRGRLGDCY